MLANKLVCGAIMAVGLLAVAGCGQAAPQGEQAAQNSTAPQEMPPEDSAAKSAEKTGQVEPATAVLPEGQTDEGVRQASATAPADPAASNAPEPAVLPSGPAAPLPLEAAVDSGSAMPQVNFTEEHAKLSLVRVGDMFPELELASLAGEKQRFGDLQGEKLTVIVFWNSQLPTSLEELADMQRRFLPEFGSQGVAVIGVNVRDDAKLAGELAEQAGAKFVNLADPDGAALAKLATAKLPRTYLIDTSGKVLWFDIEYSRTTRQQLLSALRFALKTP